jgi:hypothetical protein
VFHLDRVGPIQIYFLPSLLEKERFAKISLERGSTVDNWQSSLSKAVGGVRASQVVANCKNKFGGLLGADGLEESLQVTFGLLDLKIIHVAPSPACIKRVKTYKLPELSQPGLFYPWLPPHKSLCSACKMAIEPVLQKNKKGVWQNRCSICGKYVHKRSFADWTIQEPKQVAFQFDGNH